MICMFCLRPREEVEFLFAVGERRAQSAAICDGCVRLFGLALDALRLVRGDLRASPESGTSEENEGKS